MNPETDVILWKRCSKCGQLKSGDSFYKYKDNTSTNECKECLTAGIDNFKPETFLWLLEKFDIPYAPYEWRVISEKAVQKDPSKTGGISVFGKYLSKMKLKTWRSLGWKDSERIQKNEKEYEEYLKIHVKEIEEYHKQQEGGL